MKKKTIVLVALLLILALMLAACDLTIKEGGEDVNGTGIGGESGSQASSGSGEKDPSSEGDQGGGSSGGASIGDPVDNGTETAAYERDGEYLYFGVYPQSEVTDEAKKTLLNGKAGELPSEADSRDWTSYRYYLSDEQKDYMWYIDVEEGEDRYRGVYFTTYRPYANDARSGVADYQKENGYKVSQVYWFKYEPIKWRILHESDGVATVLCESMIDSQPFFASDEDTRIGKRPSNYEYSDVRAWLNGDFYEHFFTAAQRAIISETTLDNSARSTNPKGDEVAFNAGRNTYAGKSTTDKIFLLSVYEATDGAYGFAETNRAEDTGRVIAPSDYAKAMGAYHGRWWLRSPAANAVADVYCVNGSGVVYDRYGVDSTSIGIVPAMRIKL